MRARSATGATWSWTWPLTTIGIDPRVLFEWIARKVPAEVAGPVRALGKRDALDPAEFGFALVEEEDGPRYYWTR
jgi:hypothetical protein